MKRTTLAFVALCLWSCNGKGTGSAGPDAGANGSEEVVDAGSDAGPAVDAGAPDAGSCGDGVVEGSKECDLGSLNGTGQGCTSNCMFDCMTNADCGDGSCSNATCVQASVMGETVMRCQGPNELKCTRCPQGFCDGAGHCDPSVCGDDCLDVERREQCDDGNLYDLDGCDSRCEYETVTRMTSIVIETGEAPAFCTPRTNALGTRALTSTAISQINPPLATDVTDAVVNVMTQFFGLTDLTGMNDSSGLTVGFFSATPDPADGQWRNDSALDWWFLASPTGVSQGLPLNTLSASISDGVLTAGPGQVLLELSLAGTPAALQLTGANLSATINGSPAASLPSPPPNQLAPDILVFQTLSATSTTQGLCGNITVESLAQTPVPEALSSSGTSGCESCLLGSHSYTYCGAGQPVGPGCNSLLDVLVGGCQVGLCTVSAVNATQPDVPAVAGGAVSQLSLGASNKVPASQSTADEDGYSAYLTFTANRAHFTGEACAQTSDCQTGKTCTGGRCQ